MKEPQGKYQYKSKLTGEYVMAHQWIAETLATRKALFLNETLPDRFWKHNKEWEKEFKKQVTIAATLIKKYSEEAVFNFLKNNPYKFSLRTKENIEKIKLEQDKINTRVIEKEIETENINVFEIRKTKNKSLLSKLNGKKEK